MSNGCDAHKGLTRRELLKYSIYGGLASSLAPGFWFSACTKKKQCKINNGPNIIIITLDTTRADHLSCYGYHRQTSPNIDKLAEESVLYSKAIAPSSWTLPSHASLFTGKFTSSHGAQYDPEGPLQLTDAIRGHKTWRAFRARGLAQDEITLPGILKDAGYSTGAVVGGPWLKKVFGLNKGFEYYDDREISGVNGRLARQVTASALKWIKSLKGENFFLFLNYFDPHNPFSPPEGFFCSFLPISNAKDLLKGRKPTTKENIDLYDGEILYMDHYIGQFFQKLKTDNLYDNSMIIVTADHGELFGEHGLFGHGHYLYQEEIHIPLFIKYPGTEVTPDRIDVPIQLNDIMAIILARLGISLPCGVQAGIPPRIGHPLLAEVYPLSVLSLDGHWRAIFEKDYKFLWNSKGNHLLFNLSDDLDEKHNLASVKPDHLKNMMSDLKRYLAKLPKPGTAPAARDLDESTKSALKSLGYVE